MELLMAKKRCIVCGTWFIPNPRTAKTQKACFDPDCRKERKRRADKSWRERNPDWSAGRVSKVRDWNAQYPDYWRQYRAGHQEYRQREQERMRCNRVLSVAKQDAIRTNPVGYLRDIRYSGAKTVAKQDAIASRLDGVLEYLTVCAVVAKPNDMANGAPG
jgi:hypothetical protein